MDYSILIPVYNEDVSALVKRLHSQICKLDKPGELILLDDASPSYSQRLRNRKLAELSSVKYVQLDNNTGRSAVRNQLADLSIGKNLIFLDADVSIPDEYFLKRYQDYFDKEQVVVGGHEYTREKPKPSLLLNWNYGRKYESKPAAKRNQNAYGGFISMNFMIPRQWIKKNKFPEDVTGWGHEDTLFGHLLKKEKLPVIHIDNPVIHLGLSETSVFLKKQREAIRQAILLAERYPEFSYRLSKFYCDLPGLMKKALHGTSWLLLPLLSHLCRLTHSPLILNIYKLVFFASVQKKKNHKKD